MTESLSDKKILFYAGEYRYREKHLKQFIKDLKEDIQLVCDAITQARLYSKIDKLAGDKLIK